MAERVLRQMADVYEFVYRVKSGALMRQIDSRFFFVRSFGGLFGDEFGLAAAPEPAGENKPAQSRANWNRPRCKNATDERAAAGDCQQQRPERIAGEFEFVLRRGVEQRDGQHFAFLDRETFDQTRISRIVPQRIPAAHGWQIHEAVTWRRRWRAPFERAAVPWIWAREDAVLFADKKIDQKE